MKKSDWPLSELAGALVGTVLLAVGVNVFIVPHALYNGNLLGISQLLRTLIVTVLPLSFPFDISGLIYYVLNIPVMILAYLALSRNIFWRTIFCVTLQTILLLVIPSPATPILSDLLTSSIVGGLLVGYGSGLILRCHCTGGGTDVLGLYFTHKYSSFSVGRLSIYINVVVYTICALTLNVETAVYSIIYATVSSLVVDRVHTENICSEALIVAQEDPSPIIQFIVEHFHHTATYWSATGGYDGKQVYLIMTILSKYEMRILERYLRVSNAKVFVVQTNGVGVSGLFNKNLF